MALISDWDIVSAILAFSNDDKEFEFSYCESG